MTLAVQPVCQTAYNDHALLCHFQRKLKRRLPSVGTGAAGADHTHIALPVQAGDVAGGVQHQRQIGQVKQPRGVHRVIGGQDFHARKQAVVIAFLIVKGGSVAQLVGGGITQAKGRCLLAQTQPLVELFGIGV